MWTRMDLKMRGREAFRRNYWSCVIVAFLMALFTAATYKYNITENSDSVSYSRQYSYSSVFDIAGLVGMIFTAFAALLAVIMAVVRVVVGYALIVGGSRFFIVNQTENASAGTIGYGFTCGSYGNIILTMFLRDLFTALWSLLFIVPGIIKSYEYRMIPYILAENPGMNYKEAFQISKQMMYGQKMDVFVLDLSFIGWRILESITFGVVGLFYVEPYYQATFAELYAETRARAFSSGIIH